MDSHWICPKSVRPPATQSLAWVAIWQSGNLRGGDWSKKTLTSACKGFWNGVKCSENRSSPTACKAPFPRRHPSPPGAMHFSSQAHNPPFLAPERLKKAIHRLIVLYQVLFFPLFLADWVICWMATLFVWLIIIDNISCVRLSDKASLACVSYLWMILRGLEGLDCDCRTKLATAEEKSEQVSMLRLTRNEERQDSTNKFPQKVPITAQLWRWGPGILKDT